jgi:hypothetical protein
MYLFHQCYINKCDSFRFKETLSFPHHLAAFVFLNAALEVDSLARFFLSSFPDRPNPLLQFNLIIVRSAFLVLVSRVRLFELFVASHGAPCPALWYQRPLRLLRVPQVRYHYACVRL